MTDNIPFPLSGKKPKVDKGAAGKSKKVNFEDTDREGTQVIEGGRVTPSLVKVRGAPLLHLMPRTALYNINLF